MPRGASLSRTRCLISPKCCRSFADCDSTATGAWDVAVDARISTRRRERIACELSPEKTERHSQKDNRKETSVTNGEAQSHRREASTREIETGCDREHVVLMLFRTWGQVKTRLDLCFVVALRRARVAVVVVLLSQQLPPLMRVRRQLLSFVAACASFPRLRRMLLFLFLLLLQKKILARSHTAATSRPLRERKRKSESDGAKRNRRRSRMLAYFWRGRNSLNSGGSSASVYRRSLK